MPRTPYSSTAPVIDATALAAVVWGLDPHRGWGGDWSSFAEAAATPAVFAAIWLFAACHVGVYRVPPRQDLRLSLRRSLDAWLATWGLGGLVALTLLPP